MSPTEPPRPDRFGSVRQAAWTLPAASMAAYLVLTSLFTPYDAPAQPVQWPGWGNAQQPPADGRFPYPSAPPYAYPQQPAGDGGGEAGETDEPKDDGADDDGEAPR